MNILVVSLLMVMINFIENKMKTCLVKLRIGFTNTLTLGDTNSDNTISWLNTIIRSVRFNIVSTNFYFLNDPGELFC